MVFFVELDLCRLELRVLRTILCWQSLDLHGMRRRAMFDCIRDDLLQQFMVVAMSMRLIRRHYVQTTS